MIRAQLFLMVLTAVAASGCAQHRIACHTPKHAATLTEIHEQQVLDNLAMFAVNSGSTPYYALPNGGGSLTSQSATVGTTALWNPTTFTGINGNMSGTGGLTIQWTMKPINEPERINLMKCVYWHVTQRCPESHCIDCDKNLRNYFGDSFACCAVPLGWYSVSKKKPKSDDCGCKVGHYCGTYVSVSPRYYHYLSLVTVSILDIATADSVALASRLQGSPKLVSVEETFEVTEDGRTRTVKGVLKKSAADYEHERSKGVPREIEPPELSSKSVEQQKLERLFLPEIRQRRDSGSSLESLIQLQSAQ